MHNQLTSAKVPVVFTTIREFDASMVTVTWKLRRVDRVVGVDPLSHAVTVAMLTTQAGRRAQVGRTGGLCLKQQREETKPYHDWFGGFIWTEKRALQKMWERAAHREEQHCLLFPGKERKRKKMPALPSKEDSRPNLVHRTKKVDITTKCSIQFKTDVRNKSKKPVPLCRSESVDESRW